MTDKSRKSNVDYEKRRSRRIPQSSKLYCHKYLFCGDEIELKQPLVMELMNISVDGLGIKAEQKFEDSTILILDIVLEDILYEKITAKILWGIPYNGVYRYGLEISALSGRLYKHLCSLDNSIIRNI
ncbi:MAG: PilZ domain-containing protein [Bacillota bacterium]